MRRLLKCKTEKYNKADRSVTDDGFATGPVARGGYSRGVQQDLGKPACREILEGVQQNLEGVQQIRRGYSRSGGGTTECLSRACRELGVGTAAWEGSEGSRPVAIRD